ncbi:hypothetical protein J421_6361 (plasmid) [Gemmatirosa kalamazoonensis]|uniref:Prepilin-type N-terminal cleavage/methylation domain-containing protein n=1 Tax=Gemmatirosa kalamazoonensis TaxID=861299 RepID=W0RT77_9BACT|nr:hypothetical protein [Gemmatirosa kalamazoonensis]AHG93896.1 hypothetical protein J421_6361 [Gemmatirosa kalamazoonensis]
MPLTPRSGRRAARPGFSIVELLVTIVLVLVIGGAVAKVFVTQLRGYNRTRESVAIQRDLRTGLGLLPVDLRAASVQLGDVVSMSDSAVRLRANFGTSVICGRPTTSTLDLPPQNLARNVLTSWYTDPKPGDWVAVYVTNDLDPSNDSWRMLQIVSIGAAPSTSCPGAPFTDPVLDPPASKPRWRVTLNDTVSVVDGGPGRPVRFLRLVRYALYQASTTTKRWYLGYADSVGGKWNATEAVAGPFAPYAATGSGVRFRYYDTTGVLLPTPPGLGARIGRVDVTLRGAARVRGEKDTVVVRDSLLLRIALRNRQTQ